MGIPYRHDGIPMSRLPVLMLLAWLVPALAGPPPAELQQAFNQRYADYLRPDSEALLPFAALDKPACQQLIHAGGLDVVFVQPGVAYNAKVYTLTLYRDRTGYYLEAKGGFWGMDQVCYGPLAEEALR